MNIEFLMIVAMTVGGLLFSLGGLSKKWLRRFLLPFILGVICLIAGKELWRCLALWVGLTGAFHLGYGGSKPYWYKTIVGIAFVFPTLALGFTIWQIITPVAFIGMFKLSNWKPMSGEFAWKICEFLSGALIGITVARLIS